MFSISGENPMLKTYRTAIFAILMLFLAASLALSDDDTFSRRMMTFPRVNGYDVLCGDFHIHTIHSDGKLTPRERITEAWKYGYDAISITDHRNYNAYSEALPLADSLGLILVRGMETGMKGMEHYVALGFTPEFDLQNDHSWADKEGEETAFYQERMRKLEKTGGLLIYAHPHKGYRECTDWGIKQGIIRGIEVMNNQVGTGWGSVEFNGVWCYPFALDWALEHNLTIFANSDIHRPREGETAVTLVLVKEKSARGVMDAIRGRRTIAWFNGMLWGRENLLTDLMKSIVQVQYTVDDELNGWMVIKNLSPVTLSALPEAGPALKEAVEIGPYSEVLIQRTRTRNDLSIRWENIWTSSTENLVTMHTYQR